jgi:hypothetical protein
VRVAAVAGLGAGEFGEAAFEDVGEAVDAFEEILGVDGGDEVGAGAFDDALDGVVAFAGAEGGFMEIEADADDAGVAEEFAEDAGDFVFGGFAEVGAVEENFGVHGYGGFFNVSSGVKAARAA